MARYKLTNKAVDDLTQIWNYTKSNWSENQADNYYQMLFDNINDIAFNPDLGKIYTGIFEGLLGFRAGQHIIFYRKIGHREIEVIRILHKNMDLKNRIKDK